MEIKSSSLKNKQQVANDLKEILELVNDGKQGYQSAAEATENPELQALFLGSPENASFMLLS